MKKSMKQSIRRLLALLLTIILALGLLAGFSPKKAEAAGSLNNIDWITVKTFDEFRTAMTSAGTIGIRLGKDLHFSTEENKVQEKNDNGEYKHTYKSFNTIQVNGTKVLDMNGYDVNVTDESNIYYYINYGNYKKVYTTSSGCNGTMINVRSGASLTLMDSSGKETEGALRYTGHMVGTHVTRESSVFSLSEPAYADHYQDICRRDIITVEGELVVDGGRISAGRAKKQWVDLPLWTTTIYDSRDSTGAEGDVNVITALFHYDLSRYVDQIITGNGVIVKAGGTLIADKGRITGCGQKRQALEVQAGGTAVLNGTMIGGLYGADCFKIEDDSTVNVNYVAAYTEEGIRPLRAVNESSNYQCSACFYNLRGKVNLPAAVIDADSECYQLSYVKGKEKRDYKEASEVAGLERIRITPSESGNVFFRDQFTPIDAYKLTYDVGSSRPLLLYDQDGEQHFGLENRLQLGEMSKKLGLADAHSNYYWTLIKISPDDSAAATVTLQSGSQSLTKPADNTRVIFKKYQPDGYANTPYIDLSLFSEYMAPGETYVLSCTAEEKAVGILGNKKYSYWTGALTINTAYPAPALTLILPDSEYTTAEPGSETEMTVKVSGMDDYPITTKWSIEMVKADKDWNILQSWTDSSKGINPEITDVLKNTEAGRFHYRLEFKAKNKAGDLLARRFLYFTIDVKEPCKHQWEFESTTATCKEAGVTTYRCALCQEEKEEEVSYVDHEAALYCLYDDEYCWNPCIWCDAQLNLRAHTDDYSLYTTYVECDTTEYMYTCNNCSYCWVVSDKPKTKHMYSLGTGEKNTVKDPSSHSWSMEGNYNGYMADSSYHWRVCKNCTATEKLEHTYSGGVCTTCGFEEVQFGITGYSCIHGSTLGVELLDALDNERVQDFKNGNVTIEWKRDTDANSIGTGSTYTLTAADEGHSIYCYVTYPDEMSWFVYMESPIITTYSEVAGYAATCRDEGLKAHKICLGCGKAFDSKGNEISSVTIPKTTDHVYDNSCDSVCNVCGYVRTVTHTNLSGLKSNKNEHYKECLTCGAIVDAEAHTRILKVDKEATCAESGHGTYVCEVCDYKSAEVELPAKPHEYGDPTETVPTCTEDGSIVTTCKNCKDTITVTLSAQGHTLFEIAACEATCMAAGLKAHYKCYTCGAFFEDAEGTKALTMEEVSTGLDPENHVGCLNGDPLSFDETGHFEICACGETLETEEHSFTEWTVEQEPTHTATGLRSRNCTVCGYSEAEELPATEEHDFVYTYDENEHWEECECGEIRNRSSHKYTLKDNSGYKICEGCEGYKDIIEAEEEMPKARTNLLPFVLIALGILFLVGGIILLILLLLLRKKKKEENAEATDGQTQVEAIEAEADAEAVEAAPATVGEQAPVETQAPVEAQAPAEGQAPAKSQETAEGQEPEQN